MYEKNKKILAKALKKIKKNGIQNIINGKSVWAKSGATFQNTSPVDGALIAEVAKSDKLDIDKAARAASKAFKAWRDTTYKEKRDVLYAIAAEIEANAAGIAVLESYDTLASPFAL